ncbi:MAG: hypothetical protein PQJ50_01060 [Spirochaetales bacterium]|nr:hypothetical protein [Spirochaetales bacterium]
MTVQKEKKRKKELTFSQVRLLWIIAVVLFVQVWHFKIMEDHNGDKIFTFRLVPTWELLEDKGKAVVLEFHTIETNYGPIKIRPFCIANYENSTIYATSSKSFYDFDFDIHGMKLNSSETEKIIINSDYRSIDPPMSLSCTQSRYNKAYIFLNQKFYIRQFMLNKGLYNDITFINSLSLNADELTFLSKPNYGLGIFIQRSPETISEGISDSFTLSDSTVCEHWTSTIYMPTDSDWRLSHSGYDHPEKVIFPNGTTIEASFVFFKPNFGPVTKIVTQNKVVLGINED